MMSSRFSRGIERRAFGSSDQLHAVRTPSIATSICWSTSIKDASLFDMGGLMEDLEELLAPHRVDLVSTGGLLTRDTHISAARRPL